LSNFLVLGDFERQLALTITTNWISAIRKQNLDETFIIPSGCIVEHRRSGFWVKAIHVNKSFCAGAMQDGFDRRVIFEGDCFFEG